MLKRTLFICLVSMYPCHSSAQEQANNEGVGVEVVAIASEYVPRSTTVSHPGHSYKDCLGNTSYFGRFHSYGDSGSVSGTAETDTLCSTTFLPPTGATLTEYLSSVAQSAPSAQAQTASTPGAKAALNSDALTIGTVTLRLGMPKEAVLSELGKHYALQEDLPSTELFDNWRIQGKTRVDEFLGDVRFRSGKLTLASKVWTHESKEYSGADTAEIIYEVLSKFVGEGKVNCTIQTFASLQPSGPGHLEFREAEVTCGHRQIDVALMWQSGPGWVQVNESITDEPEMPRKPDAPAGRQ